MDNQTVLPEKPYAVVEFSDGLALIPVTWSSDNNKKCFYLTHTNQLKINKDVSTRKSPDCSWNEYGVKRVIVYAESYEKGIKKFKLAEEISDLDSDHEKKIRHFRHIPKQRRIIESDDSELDPDSEDTFLPPPPKRPAVARNSDDIMSSRGPSVAQSVVNTLSSPTPSCSSTPSCTPLLVNHLRQCLDATPKNNEHQGDAEFKEMVLTKLNQLIHKVNALEKYILLNQNQENGEVEEIQQTFPIPTREEILTPN